MWGHDYEQFVGVKRGYWPWQATFNRVYLFKELLERGRGGWCLYMDADAYIRDLDFDLLTYLNRHRESLLVCTASGASEIPYDVNVGVMALNLGHELAGDLVSKWIESFSGVSEDQLKLAEREWPLGMPDDQVMLQWILRDNPRLMAGLHHAPPSLMNTPRASFIRQYLRALDSNLETRTRHLRQITDHVMDSLQNDRSETPEDFGPSSQHFTIVEGLYYAVLKRSADEYGRLAFAQILLHEGLGRGVPHVVETLLGGDEYRQRFEINH